MYELKPEDRKLLGEIAEAKRYSLVQFQLLSSQEGSLRSTALPNVHLEAEDETMEAVKARSAQLQQLADNGYIELDFRPAIYVVRDYTIYYQSQLYKQLCGLTEESKKKPDFLFDIPHIKKGRVVLTKAGRTALEQKK